MSDIKDTAYPRFKDEITKDELELVYTPTAKERAHFNTLAALRRPKAKACAMIQFKVMQRLGYAVPLANVPVAITAHVCRKLKLSRPSLETLTAYDGSAEYSRHRELARKTLGLRDVDSSVMAWVAERSEAAASTKHELEDIINSVLEELARERIILPGFTLLLRAARTARDKVHTAIFGRTLEALDQATRDRLDALLVIHDGRSDWDRLKREPKQPTKKEVASFLGHIRWLAKHAQGLPGFASFSVSKLSHFTLEARALNANEMRDLVPSKRYTLATLLIQSCLKQSKDDIAEIFIKTVRRLNTDAERKLKEYQAEHQDQAERLAAQLRDSIVAYQAGKNDAARGVAVGASFEGGAEAVLEECVEFLAYAGNNYFPFMLRPYGAKRSLLFECLDVIQPMPTYVDEAFSLSLIWCMENRSSHKEYLRPFVKAGAELKLDWLSDRWRQLIIVRDADDQVQVHRKYLELATFTRIFEELQSGDLFVPDSDQYDDYRERLMSQEQFEAELPEYLELMGLPATGAEFVEQIKERSTELAHRVDRDFPGNDSVAWGPNGIIIRRLDKSEPPPELTKLDEAINSAMGLHNIVDVLTEVEDWLKLHKLFRPLSGYESKLENPRARFISTLFCYGCNMGPSQTARSLTGVSRKQIAWLNIHHVTEEKLQQAIDRVTSAYKKFSLPSFWGSGKHAAADGTKWEMYEKNLVSEYHIRYGGYGAIGYYHVSDTYIALFSHFIPCGVYEAIYILDGLIRNESDIQPDTLHGDTQAQSTPVFALAHLLGISLMPRIRNIRDLTFFRPDKDVRFQNIEPLFSGPSVDWERIAVHYEELLRVALSIKAGMMTPSTLLRRLGSTSRKNKLYYAFRELGRVMRTMFLLRYISEPDLRRTIHAETNKAEEFHAFANWAFFGQEGVLAENIRHEQRKMVKYNHLVANMVILHNVHLMSKVLKALQERGEFQITEDLLAALAPYRTAHINRYGEYVVNFDRTIEPMSTRIRFGLKAKNRQQA